MELNIPFSFFLNPGSECLGIFPLDDIVHLLFAQTRRGLDGDFLLTTRSVVSGRYFSHSIGVDLEGDVDLGQSGGRGLDPDKVEGRQRSVLRRRGVFTLKNMDPDPNLVVLNRGE